tara:strand:+ start:9969 stop:10184 length:216 start_codon:yes stop_codon:yes gene_type:complete
MWGDILISSVGTIGFLFGSFHLGKFCERKRLELSLNKLKEHHKEYNKERDKELKEIDNLMKEHLDLLEKLN